MPDPDTDARIAEVVVGLLRLGRHLDPANFDDLIGAIGVEVDTGMELVLERRLGRGSVDNVVALPIGRRSPFEGLPPGTPLDKEGEPGARPAGGCPTLG